MNLGFYVLTCYVCTSIVSFHSSLYYIPLARVCMCVHVRVRMRKVEYLFLFSFHMVDAEMKHWLQDVIECTLGVRVKLCNVQGL